MRSLTLRRFVISQSGSVHQKMSPDCDDLLENISSDLHSRPHFAILRLGTPPFEHLKCMGPAVVGDDDAHVCHSLLSPYRTVDLVRPNVRLAANFESCAQLLLSCFSRKLINLFESASAPTT